MPSISTYAFDVYGTLIDTNGVLEKLRQYTGEQAEAISATWRAKQLEYSFRRGLMQHYRPFPKVTEQALAYALAVHRVDLPQQARIAIQKSYSELPAFQDAKQALQALQHQDIGLFAFSNGPKAVVVTLLRQAELLPYFKDVVSVESTKVFKPSPIVYEYFARQAGQSLASCALISGNSFDVLGAKAAGMQGIWVQRDQRTIFDPWETTPNQIIKSLTELVSS